MCVWLWWLLGGLVVFFGFARMVVCGGGWVCGRVVVVKKRDGKVERMLGVLNEKKEVGSSLGLCHYKCLLVEVGMVLLGGYG